MIPEACQLDPFARWPCSRGDPFKGLLVALPPWSEPGAPDGGSTKRTIFPRRHLLPHILSVRMPSLGGSGFNSESVHHLFFFWLAVPPPGFAAAPESLRTWAEIRVVPIGLVMSISGLVHLMKWAWSCQVTRSKQQSFLFFSRSQHLSWHVEYSILLACRCFQQNSQSCISRSKSLVVYRTIFWLPRS